MKKVRESNFELLRCILMFMVVLVHYNNSDMGKAFLYVTPGSFQYYLIYFMESLAIIGTNGFVLLTGYFSWRKKEVSLRKPVGLLIYVVAYNVLFYILNVVLLHQTFSLFALVSTFIPRNWYIILYVVLTLFSPYINVLIERLDKKSYLTLIGLLFLLFSIWPTLLDIAESKLGISTVGMNTIALAGSSNGYSIVNFVMLYLIGAAISKFDLLTHGKIIDLLCYLGFSCIIFVQQIKVGVGWSYANPFVIVSCISFFNIFRKIHLKSNLINMLSKATLGVFLVHSQYMVCIYLWGLSGIAEACQSSVWVLGIHMMVCCIVTYLLCSIFDMLCRTMVKPISNLLDQIPILNKKFISIKEN